MINLNPAECNLCSGTVEYTSNTKIYRKEYGSVKCYLCLNCRAYVGTHKPYPDVALGILANAEMREWKIKCHELFDKLCQSETYDTKRGKRYYRNKYYRILAAELNIDKEICHFRYFDLDMLKRAYDVLTTKNLKTGKKIAAVSLTKKAKEQMYFEN